MIKLTQPTPAQRELLNRAYNQWLTRRFDGDRK